MKKVKAHPKVTENVDKIAIEGPILYCAEGPDNTNGEVLNVVVNKNQDFKLIKSNILGGIYTIEGSAKRAKNN